MYKCNPTNTYLTTSVEVDGGKLVLTVNELNLANIENLTKFNLRICQKIPGDACTKRVFVSDGCTELKLLLTIGNIVRADQINTRTVYPIIFGNDTSEHLSLLCKVKCSKYEVPTVVERTSVVAEATSEVVKTSKKGE